MPELNQELQITRIDTMAKGVLRLTLEREDKAVLPAWDPGAHIDLKFTANGVDYVRQYSLCGRQEDRRQWQVAVLRVADGRGGSAHIHKALAERDKIHVAGPRNNFPLVPASRYLFIAGGIGITPVLAMIAKALASGADWRLFYSGRSATSMAFIDEVLAFGADKVVIHESDTRGLADLAAITSAADVETVVYCCGPESMLRTVEESCIAWSPERVHMERFSPADTVEEGENISFEVEFARSGIVVNVPPDRSILDMAEEAGVDIESSCQDGVCGSCETKVISGTPDHRDSVLSAKQRASGKSMMVCVSRSCSGKLVLDA